MRSPAVAALPRFATSRWPFPKPNSATPKYASVFFPPSSPFSSPVRSVTSAPATCCSPAVVEAKEAQQLGLVSEIVEPDKLMSRAQDLTDYLVEVSPGSLSRAKRLLVTAEAAAVDADLERAVLENARIRCTPDFKEGIASFLEKRKPIWKDE